MKFRLTCFAVHLLVSAGLALLALFVVFNVWYPAPLASALGVADIFILVLCIDVVLGPLLTLVVAKRGKKTLKADFLTIAFLQISALVYGLYIVAEGRPVWLVYDAGRFEVVLAHEAISDTANTEKSAQNNPVEQAYIRAGFSGPLWATTGNIQPVIFGRGDGFLHAENLQPLSPVVATQAIAQAMPLAVLESFNSPEDIKALRQAHPKADAFIPMVAKQRPLVVLVNQQTRELIAIADVLPW